MGTDPIIPTQIEQVTADWLSSVLNQSIAPETVQSEKIGTDFGFASQLYRISYNESSLVVKFWPTATIGTREILFYQSFHDSDSRIPHCLYSGSDDQKQRAILLLEDFTQAAQGDVLKKLNLEQAKNLADALAQLHTKWHNHELVTSASWLHDARTWKPKADWIQGRRETFKQRFPGRLNQPAMELLDNLEQAIKMGETRLKNQPITLLHGDFHLDNVLFNNGTTPILLDWDRPTAGAPAINLASLLFEMISLDHFDIVLDLYSDRFNGLIDKSAWVTALSGAFIRNFCRLTCGIARWEPTLLRAVAIIDDGIENANLMADFWQQRDPDLLRFNSAKK